MNYLIVPCFNEAERLQLEKFVHLPAAEWTILFADDGSVDGTADLIETALPRYSQFHLFRSPVNVGKGEVIRLAFLYLLKNAGNDSRMNETSWFGFWDADLATPLWEIPNMFTYDRFFYGGESDSIWCSRMYRLGSRVIRSPLRHYLGRIFATVVAGALKVESYDSQCGAKLFRLAAMKKAFERPFISPWIFDVEILLRLKDFKVIEYPVQSWEDIPGSKVKVFKEIFRVMRDILRIRKRYSIQ